MSGYLQRISAVAVGTRPRVHPFVDSMYSARSRAESVGPMVLHETETSRAETWTESKLQRVAERATAEPKNEIEPVQRLDGEKASSAQAQNKDFRPLLPEQAEEVWVHANAVRNSGDGAPFVSTAPAPLTVSQTDEVSGAMYAAKVWNYQPLIAGSEGAPKMQQRDGSGAATPRSVMQRGAGPNLIVPRPAETRSDDIQIHIGRIEVMAVPPPMPRRESVPTRKSMSLDEYLRGSSGRA